MPPKTLQTPEEVQREIDSTGRVIDNYAKRETHAASMRRDNKTVEAIIEAFKVVKWPYIVRNNKIHPPV